MEEKATDPEVLEEGHLPDESAVTSADAEVVLLSDRDPAKMPKAWMAVLVVFLKLILLTPVYAVVAVAAFGAGIGWHYFEKSAGLDISEVERLEVGALVRDLNGREIGRAGSMHRRLITREDIPDHFVDALVAAEDQRFFLHPGFDPVGSVRAAWANYRAQGIREGGSTLTQQLARDVYSLEGKDADRKLSEIAAAVRIEKQFSKDEILVHYLNRIYFGSGFYGLGSAAMGYFGKKPRELTVDESALICGVIPSPSRYSPLVSESLAMEYRDQTLRRMNESGTLSDEELEKFLAGATPVLKTREHLIERGQLRYLIARIEKELRDSLDGLSVPVKSLDGLIIETSVDLDLQLQAAKLIDLHIQEIAGGYEGGEKESTVNDDLEGAFVVIDNRSGRIVASVGSRDFFRSEYDRATEMTRPPGSAFFPFVYAAAFETGAFTPDSLVFDAPFDNREMGVGSIGGILGEWSTENPENRWDGHITASNALRYSKNSPTARLGLQVGLDPVRRLIRAAGIKSEVKEEPGSVLGGSEVTLTELTHAYTVFSNSGTPSPEPALIREIHDAFGKPISSTGASQLQRAMSAKTADSVAASLTRDVESGISKGKSGTTSGFTDVWYFGFNGDYTWGTWLGRDSYKPIRTLAYGSELAQPLAEKIMAGKKSDDAAVPVAASEKQ